MFGQVRKRQQQWQQRQKLGHGNNNGVWRSKGNLISIPIPNNKRLFRVFIITLSLFAIAPLFYFHFKLTRLNQAQSLKCGWLKSPPLVCAHGGDSIKHFPNTIAAYNSALRSQVDCIEIDVSRSADGVLLALHDRDLQRISGGIASKVGELSMKKIGELNANTEIAREFEDQSIITIEEALKFVSSSVRQVILDAKVGPPLYEKGLAKDILSVVQKAQCRNCLVWAKSDTLARDVIKRSSDIKVGYVVMKDPSTGARTNILRMRGARVVAVYHELIDKKMVQIMHGMNKMVYAWTVDDVKSMEEMLYNRVDAMVTNNSTQLQGLMQDIRQQCLEEGFSV